MGEGRHLFDVLEGEGPAEVGAGVVLGDEKVVAPVVWVHGGLLRLRPRQLLRQLQAPLPAPLSHTPPHPLHITHHTLHITLL